MQYQIREPEGFARMLEMIIETGASVFWQASEYGIRYHVLHILKAHLLPRY